MNDFLPDRIYAVGGGGIELVTELLTQDWVVEEAIRPRSDPDRVETYLLDTAVGNENEMQEREQTIEAAAREYRETEDHSVGTYGDISVESQVITDLLTLSDELDLTATRAVEPIAQAHAFDAENWWVRRDDVDETLDFARGVYRRRGLARAVFYKAVAQSRDLTDMLDMPNSGRVAIVVGLGGGTGAGVGIDLARKLLEQSPMADVTLFGVLPSPQEDERVMANAYASLSELEAVQTGDSPLFRDVVLLPLDPTGYEGKKGDLLATSGELAEFDSAFPYPFVSYYNTDDEDVFDQAPTFAPFTVAVPQVLRYSVDAIETAHDSIGEAVEALDEAYRTGQQLHREVQTFLSDHYTDVATGQLTERNRRDLEVRLSTLEEFLANDLFEEESYATARRFDETVSDARARADGDVVSVVDNLAAFSSSFDSPRRQYVDETDKALAETVEQAIEFLSGHLETLRAVAGVPDEDIREPLRKLLGLGRVDLDEVRFVGARVGDECETLAEEVAEVQQTVEQVTADFEDARERRAETIEQTLADWRRATEVAREDLAAAEEADVETAVDNLVDALRTYADDVVSADSKATIQSVEGDSVHDALDDLEVALDTVGIDPVCAADGGPLPRSDVEASLRDLRRAREASLETDVSGRYEWVPWLTEPERTRKEAQDTLRDKRTSLNQRGVFVVKGVTPESFGVDITFDGERVGAAVDGHLADSRRHVTTALAEAVGEALPAEPRERLERALQQNRLSDAETLVQDVVEQVIPAPTELEREREQVLGRLETTRDDRDRAVALDELLTNSVEGGPRQRHAAAHEAFEAAFEDYRTAGEDITGSEDDLFIEQVRPQDVMQGRQGDDIADAELLAERGEREQAERTMDRLLSGRAITTEYLSLQRRRVRDDETRYRGHKVSLGVLTRVTDHVGDVLDVREDIVDAFGLEATTGDYGSWHAPVGAPWDIGVSVFVSGVFLDNLRNLSTYADGYERRVADTDPIHLHHADRLEEGVIVRRTDIVNLADPDEATLYTAVPDERRVVDTLSGEYREVVSVEETRDGDDGTQDAAADLDLDLGLGSAADHDTGDRDDSGDDASDGAGDGEDLSVHSLSTGPSHDGDRPDSFRSDDGRPDDRPSTDVVDEADLTESDAAAEDTVVADDTTGDSQ